MVGPSEPSKKRVHPTSREPRALVVQRGKNEGKGPGGLKNLGRSVIPRILSLSMPRQVN